MQEYKNFFEHANIFKRSQIQKSEEHKSVRKKNKKLSLCSLFKKCLLKIMNKKIKITIIFFNSFFLFIINN